MWGFRFVSRFGALVPALLVGMLWAASSATAAGWSLNSPLTPIVVEQARLAGVSCTASRICEAVGSYMDVSNVSRLLVEPWNGSGWALRTPQAPANGNSGAAFDAVACRSSSWCMAVGSAGFPAAAAVWDGTTWRVRATPVNGFFAGVSCVSSSWCEAVGSVGSAPTAGVWSNGYWTRQSLPTLGAYGSLASVSCVSTTKCEAVGSYGQNSRPLIGTLNNGSWSLQPMANPPGAQRAALTGVYCPVVSASCIAVGSYVTSAGVQLPFAVTSNSEQPPAPPGAQSSSLAGIGCSSATFCVAVGSYINSSGTTVPLAEAWNGSSWKVREPPSPLVAHSASLSAVSCTSSASCVGIGAYYTSTGRARVFAELWDGTSWSPKLPINPAAREEGQLVSVSCISSSACTAVGSLSDFALNVSDVQNPTWAVRWDGSAWTIQPTPSPPGAYLTHISCASIDLCVAVGREYGTPFVELWNGNTWTVQSTPSAGSGYAYLYGVSCPSSQLCVAVGQASSAPLVELWNGNDWTVQTTPTLSGSAVLNSVSCASPTACTAVGVVYSNGTDSALAEAWNGTTWTVQETPGAPAQTSSELEEVSCPSTSMCTAVGWYTPSNGSYSTLAESWDGTAWTIQSTPNPSSARNYFYGVSCGSPTACEATGEFDTSHSYAFAEGWTSSGWTAQTLPNASSPDQSLKDVSCTFIGQCIAVGPNYGTSMPLAELWTP